MGRTVDVVVVGGGIAGSTVSLALARQGLGVITLESQKAYRDRVLGEALVPWGVVEARCLGLEEILLGAGGRYCPSVVLRDETTHSEGIGGQAVPLDTFIPGVPGILDVGHPQACEALSRAAADSGAEVVMGVSNVSVMPGTVPEIRYESDGREHAVSCRLVIGADGRHSTVRNQVGISLEESVARTRCAGLLIGELEDWPEDQFGAGSEDDLFYMVVPREEHRVRLFIFWDANDRHRFRGTRNKEEFLASFGTFQFLPWGARIAASRPAGPCVSYRLNDSWCNGLCAEGVVLIGDAAGWNDPIIGQGLAISMRDARLVSEILEGGTDWSPLAFGPYVQERTERLRRLRIVAEWITKLRCTFGPEGTRLRKHWKERSEQDESVLTPYVAHLRGPETLPAAVFEPQYLQGLLS